MAVTCTVYVVRLPDAGFDVQPDPDRTAGVAEAGATFMTSGYTATTRKKELNNAADASRIYVL